LYALDAECLAKIAAILGYEDDTDVSSLSTTRVKSLVRQLHLERAGWHFENRYCGWPFLEETLTTNSIRTRRYRHNRTGKSHGA